MKKTLAWIALILLVTSYSYAADTSTMVPTIQLKTTNMMVIKAVFTANSDGTITTKTFNESNLGTYYTQGYFLVHAFTINDATTYPASGTVTISDALGQQLIGSTAGDTLTLSTAASGLALLASTRSAAQRPVSSVLNAVVTNTGSAANIFTLYLVLSK